MSRKHFSKYFQKYYLFFSSAITILFLYACSTTKKVPDGEFLLTKNNFRYEGKKVHEEEVSDHVNQKPNKKQLFFLPFGLWMYNATNPKYDSILAEYMTYPTEMRDQKLRDSLFVKFEHPEYVGKSLFYRTSRAVLLSSDGGLLLAHNAIFDLPVMVRALERQIAKICRRAAKKYLETKQPVVVSKKDLEQFLGKPRFLETNLPKKGDKAFEGLTVHGVERIEDAMELARGLA